MRKNAPRRSPMITSVPSTCFLRMPKQKRRCEITIISFSRSICRGGLAALIGVTAKPYPSCLSCHSHPICPYGAPSPRGEGCDTRIPSSKKGGEAATRALNLEPNESKVKRGCEEMNPHFFTASFYFAWKMLRGESACRLLPQPFTDVR